jgi:membrane-bound lytic murein transglycosylase D
MLVACAAWADDPSTPAKATPAPAAIPAPTVAAPVESDEALFPHLLILKPNIDFWTKVFAQYSEYQSVIHSAEYPDRIFTILDFREQASALDPARARSLQSHEEKREKLHYERLLKQVHAKRNTPGKLNSEERRIYDLYAGIDDPMRFKRAAAEVRAQRGLKERTERALETSGKYLPEMESVFERQGLPKRLTRLPLVESSFNEEAYSKVGAAGIWQFMPSSARMYMRLDEVVDDRADPWFSTEAAAQHLKDDYAALRDWPLAVTAYNHGRGGLAHGLQVTRGDSLSDLIERYHNRHFGFASRNFYAEFLAASDVERDRNQHFGEIKRKDPLRFEQVQTSDYYIPYSTLLKLSGTDEETFRRLNPAYRPDVIDGKLYVPPGHTIRLPPGTTGSFVTAIASLTADQRYEQQRLYYVQYRVKKGDSIARIAKKQGITVAALRDANPELGKRVRRGQVLRLPPHSGSAVMLAKAAPSPKASRAKPKVFEVADAGAKPSARKAAYRTHRVRSGQTLSHIAKRYRVSIDSLRELNGLGDSSRLKPGQRLRIPTS